MIKSNHAQMIVAQCKIQDNRNCGAPTQRQMELVL
jgi:hypothetical protein